MGRIGGAALRGVGRTTAAVGLVACTFAACATGDGELGRGTDVGPSLGDPRSEGGAPRDSGGGRDAGDNTTSKDASADAPAPIDSGSDAPSSGGLDPDLELPSGTTPCTTPSGSGECPLGYMCRIASPTGGLCETCTGCGNLHASCASNLDCDILFQCFRGKCTNLCPLGTTACGPPADCIDVGHPTYGVCKP